MNVASQEQIMVGFPRSRVVRIEVNGDRKSLCGFERAGVDCFEGEVGGCLDSRLRKGGGLGGGFVNWGLGKYQMFVLDKNATANDCYSERHIQS
jgi:hypothetical protein